MNGDDLTVGLFDSGRGLDGRTPRTEDEIYVVQRAGPRW